MVELATTIYPRQAVNTPLKNALSIDQRLKHHAKLMREVRSYGERSGNRDGVASHWQAGAAIQLATQDAAEGAA